MFVMTVDNNTFGKGNAIEIAQPDARLSNSLFNNSDNPFSMMSGGI